GNVRFTHFVVAASLFRSTHGAWPPHGGTPPRLHHFAFGLPVSDLSENDFEELNALPFSRLRIDHNALLGRAIFGRRQRVNHLNRIRPGANGGGRPPLTPRPLKKRRRRGHGSPRFLRPDGRSELLGQGSRPQGRRGCDNEFFHFSPFLRARANSCPP